MQLEPLGRIPVSELDSILAKRGLRKDLAVVFVEYFWERYVETKEGEFRLADPKQKTTSQFASEVDQKLRGVGFKQVIFASQYNGPYTRMLLNPKPTWEGTEKKDATISSTNTMSEGAERLRKSYRAPTAELIKAINSTNSALEASLDFGVSEIFAELINRAGLAFEAVDSKSINLFQPRYVHWMPIAEIDRMLTNSAVQKELAVVVIGRWPGPLDGQEWKALEKFASEADEKLRKAGFKQVVFASRNYHGFYDRVPVGWIPSR